MKINAINWFEIHVSDFTKAKKFYETILGVELKEVTMDGMAMGIFPCDEDKGVGGSITQSEHCGPGAGGTTVYLNVEGDLDGVLSRIPAAGGKVIRERLPIPPHGFIGIFSDPEGNVVGLHSMV